MAAVGPNGRYRLLARVAEGGMGEVHRGVDVGWGGVERPVAVKLISQDLARHPDFVKSFVDEARLSYQLSHANVVQVRDIGQSGESWFIAFEWIDGADLGTLLKRLRDVAHQTMPLRFAVLIAVEAARGLDYAHRFRDQDGRPFHLVHRDVSPPNLLLSYEGEVKVTDFGIARWQLRQAASLPGALKGKLGYMAPEQARGEEVDARADVFALGAVMYEMLTGVNPFTTGRAENEVLERLRAGACEPPSVHLHLPPSLEAIVVRAMAPDRDARYGSCAQLREDLESFARRESYSLSPAQLGEFVRSLMQPIAPELAATERNPTLKVRTPSAPNAAPKPFDLALGAQLAALSSTRENDAGPMTVQGKKISGTAPPVEESQAPPPSAKQPVAQHPVVPGAPTTDLTAMIPRNRMPRVVVWLGAVGVVVIVVVVVIALTRVPLPPPRENVQVHVHAPVVQGDENVHVNEDVNENVNVPEEHSRSRRPVIHQTPASARLSVLSDVEAKVFVDGKFVKTAPVDGLIVAPGRHTVRVEGNERGLFLVPKEETVELKAGESKKIALELK